MTANEIGCEIFYKDVIEIVFEFKCSGKNSDDLDVPADKTL